MPQKRSTGVLSVRAGENRSSTVECSEWRQTNSPEGMANKGSCRLNYSCNSASETLEWIRAIIDFIKPYRFLLEAHVVNFFKDKLWEVVDRDWMDCLRNEPVENLLQMPSGVVQDGWPASLKEFVHTLRALSLPREQANLQEMIPGLHLSSLDNVLAQGMNLPTAFLNCGVGELTARLYNLHEQIEVLAAIVSSIAKEVGSSRILDVGAGQGYLAQVLAFEHELSVFAIDASSHHGKVTDARAERIRKHYAAKSRKSGSGNMELRMPKTVTCRVLSADTLKVISDSLIEDDKNLIQKNFIYQSKEASEWGVGGSTFSSYMSCNCSLLLAGLHACGDLSVAMLRSFLECDKIKAVISIGCCYNLLSEDAIEEASCPSGFPMSNGVKSAGFPLGKTACDLACQSAERWRGLGEGAGLHNFELHAFRAAFQMVLYQYYPDALTKSPTVGCQGKALRRQQHRRILESNLNYADPGDSSASFSQKISKDEGSCFAKVYTEARNIEKIGSPCEADACDYYGSSTNETAHFIDKYSLFVKFCESGLERLGLLHMQDIDLNQVWEETKPFVGLVGPYWSIRAALGPILEALILLDRLLFLQEQGSALEAVMVPIFDPVLSPRNMALIAKKV